MERILNLQDRDKKKAKEKEKYTEIKKKKTHIVEKKNMESLEDRLSNKQTDRLIAAVVSSSIIIKKTVNLEHK